MRLLVLTCIAPSIRTLTTVAFFVCMLHSYSSADNFNLAYPIVSEDNRFIDHGNNTITDTKTGLMWIKQDSYLHTQHWLNWFQAKQYIKKLNKDWYANYDDWEFPTLEELRSIFEPKKVNSFQLGREMKIHIDPIFGKNGAGTSWSTQKDLDEYSILSYQRARNNMVAILCPKS